MFGFHWYSIVFTGDNKSLVSAEGIELKSIDSSNEIMEDIPLIFYCRYWEGGRVLLLLVKALRGWLVPVLLKILADEVNILPATERGLFFSSALEPLRQIGRFVEIEYSYF